VTTGISAGANLYGTKMQVDANQRAAETAAKSAEEALAWQKDVYGQRQRQLAPAIGVGNAATLKLGDLMGLQAPAGGYQPPASSQPAPPAPVDPNAGTPHGANPNGAPTTGQAVPRAQALVPMVDPNGRAIQVPADRVAEATAHGARSAA
jgi:hypothetical protein